jgi:uncharacterized membrane protein YgdD (TMEM256/DUF423 family)
MSSRFALKISAGLGFAAVALGAFGAHTVKDVLVRHDTAGIWQTAALYHLVHSVLLVFIAGREEFARLVWWFVFTGVLVFSGSLYVLALTNLRWLGAVTPLGGLCLLAGWLALLMQRRA